jgi:hypothetical protein
LREASIERAVEAFPEAASIFERNIDTLEKLGARRLESTRHEARPAWRRDLIAPRRRDPPACKAHGDWGFSLPHLKAAYARPSRAACPPHQAPCAFPVISPMQVPR